MIACEQNTIYVLGSPQRRHQGQFVSLGLEGVLPDRRGQKIVLSLDPGHGRMPATVLSYGRIVKTKGEDLFGQILP